MALCTVPPNSRWETIRGWDSNPVRWLRIMIHGACDSSGLVHLGKVMVYTDAIGAPRLLQQTLRAESSVTDQRGAAHSSTPHTCLVFLCFRVLCFVVSISHCLITITHSHTLLVTCTCCCDVSKGTKTKISHAHSLILSHQISPNILYPFCTFKKDWFLSMHLSMSQQTRICCVLLICLQVPSTFQMQLVRCVSRPCELSAMTLATLFL